MKLLEKVVSFLTLNELREWFQLGSASAPRIMMTSVEPIKGPDGRDVWQTRVHITGQDAALILQSRIGQSFLHIRKEFPKHTIGVSDRAYNKIKFYDPEYRETHQKKRPEKAHAAHNTAIADAFMMAKEKKRSKEVYRKSRDYQLGYSDRRTNRSPRMDDVEYMKGYNARDEREKAGPRERLKGLRKNSMTWILVEYIKNHGGEVTRKHLTEQFGAINGSVVNRMIHSGLVESLGAGRYVHKDNRKDKAPEAVLSVPEAPEAVLSAPKRVDLPSPTLVERPVKNSRGKDQLMQRVAELEAENTRLKKALSAVLTG
jgi:hypothetical protein